MKTLLLTLIVSLSCVTASYAMENTFYILHSKHPEQSVSMRDATDSLKKHPKSIHVLISQAYQINGKGDVSGYLDPAILAFTKQHRIKEFAMVTNHGYDPEIAHRFLTNEAAQTAAIETLVTFCTQQQLAGIQFDFEGIAIADKEALTHFYTAAATALHKQGKLVSFAVVPVEEGSDPSTVFLKRKYDNWGGAYDLQRLAPVADFITIMAYDQHNEGATPGPTASLTWVDATLQYALKFIPANKISLGIPAYSDFWYTAARSNKPHAHITMRLDNISYDQLTSLLKKNRAHLQWDNQRKLHYAIYEHHWLYEYLFAEDAQSFNAKRALARKYHLRGISVFALGHEDKRIWKVLAS